MFLSLTAFLTLLTTSLLLVLLLRRLLRKNEVLLRTGTRIYLVLFILMAVRLFIPFELGFEKTILVTRVLPWLRTASLETAFSIFGYQLYLRSVLLFGWAAGAVIAAFCSIRRYLRLKKLLLACSSDCDDFIATLLRRLNRRGARRPVAFSVLQCSELTTPFVFGFLRPVIILPDRTMPKTDWRLILLHEMEHFYHGDLWVKLLFEVTCIVYWWNPFVYILRSQVDMLLEMINDRRVAKHLSQKQTFRYLSCILKVAKSEPDAQCVPQAVAALAQREHTRLVQRIHLAAEAMCTHVPAHLQRLLIAGICVLFFFSYSFVLEPYYECPEPGLDTLTSENGYIVRNGELYDIYMDGELFLTAKDPDEAHANLPIYNLISEVPK